MLKQMPKRCEWAEKSSPKARKLGCRILVAPDVALLLLIFSVGWMLSPRLSALARAQDRTVALAAGGEQGASPQSAGAEEQEEEQQLDGWERPISALPKDRKPAPAPRRDLSGVWDPGVKGIGMFGSTAMPDDGKPEHQPPYTPLGLEMLKRSKPNNGPRAVLPEDTNDPVFKYGDPQGMPREDLYELRTLQIYKSPQNIAILYQFNKVWRVIWTDGRELPKNPEPRWYGYSIGKWVDNYTFDVETVGLNETTWIDRSGRPHSADLRVEERFHRPDRDHLELSVTIDDPKMYTKPWVALDRLVFELEPASFDVREMIWSQSEYEEYNKLIGNTISGKKDRK